MPMKDLLEKAESTSAGLDEARSEGMLDIEQQIKELGEDMSDSISDFLFDLTNKIDDGVVELNAKELNKIEVKLMKAVKDLEVSTKHFLESFRRE